MDQDCMCTQRDDSRYRRSASEDEGWDVGATLYTAMGAALVYMWAIGGGGVDGSTSDMQRDVREHLKRFQGMKMERVVVAEVQEPEEAQERKGFLRRSREWLMGLGL
jgi:hypothetical protein